MSSKRKSVSLAEKISNLVTAVPKSFGSDNEEEETNAKVVDFDDEIDALEEFKNEFHSSNIRKRNVGLLEDTDTRYKGKKVSSKEIFNKGDSSGGSDLSDAYDDEGESAGGSEKNESDSEEDNMSLKYAESDEGENNNDAGSSQEEEEEEENEDDDDDDDDENDEEDEDEDGEVDDEEGSDMDDDFDDSVDLSNPLRRDRTSAPGIKTISATNIRAEIDKGNCVREQLKLWENLLEMRIKIQKCVVNSNKMPQYDIFKNYDSNDEFKDNCKSVKNKLSGLLTNLLSLQSNLLNNFPETKDILSKGKKRKGNDDEEESNNEDDSMDEEIPSDTEDEMKSDGENDNEEEESEKSDGEEKKGPVRKKMKLSEFENIIAKNHNVYKEYRNSVIQKWNDKTRIASGVISKGPNQPAVKQIEFALANKDKLLKKTQLKRSEYEIIGKSPNSLEDNDGRRTQEYDSEIYDDDDFYHQLLRELIEYKSADITDPIQLSKQWIQLQNMRSKMKRKIDTRATKGRRIRYDVHQKLVNFMAPITVNDTWTDHAKDELYSSLFGRIKVNKESSKDNGKETNKETT